MTRYHAEIAAAEQRAAEVERARERAEELLRGRKDGA